MASFSRNLYLWLRKLHLYFGLYISPFVLVFAISTILLNHGWKADGRLVATATREGVEADEGLNNLELGKDLMRKLNLLGEFAGLQRFPNERRLALNVTRPGKRTTIQVELEKGVARIEERDMGLLDAMRFLHVMPGPHKVRGPDWVFTKVWRWMADATVCLLIFTSISGIYMWAVIRAERKAGLLMLGSGCLTFAGLFASLVYL